ncbi:MAG: AAA family ATPase, partial [Xanthomonadaceae bacterium]|nr:AAA family ATPase [Rhodospirillaceae bacterium]NIA18247.1 AAA family ATPase [Xanthomonadaceae bacterium]
MRNYKCYQSTQLIKFFSNDEKFIGFIGENGVGKSAVLQALNSFFTGQNWIRNKTGKKGKSKCGVAPVVFCDTKFLQKQNFSETEIKILKDVSNTIKKNLKELNLTMGKDAIFLSCMLFQGGNTEMFNGSQIMREKTEDKIGDKKEDDKYQKIAKKVKELFLSYFRYIYIDAEVNIDTSADINFKTFELIKGSGVIKDIEKELKRLTIKYKEKKLSISGLINNIVIQYLDGEVVSKLKEVDKDYDYKNLKPGAQSKMSEKLIGELATQALFNNRELTKKIQNKDIEISSMSSGQRRKAFLDFVVVMISNLDDEVKNKTMLAIDEPEISVDASSRIQQFEKLRQLSNQGVSVLFTTHWYGWIIQLIDGSNILIKENSDGREIYQSSIFDFSNISILNIKQHKMRM